MSRFKPPRNASLVSAFRGDPALPSCNRSARFFYLSPAHRRTGGRKNGSARFARPSRGSSIRTRLGGYRRAIRAHQLTVAEVEQWQEDSIAQASDCCGLASVCLICSGGERRSNVLFQLASVTLASKNGRRECLDQVPCRAGQTESLPMPSSSPIPSAEPEALTAREKEVFQRIQRGKRTAMLPICSALACTPWKNTWRTS